jgi:hypothetical protein
VTEDLVAVWKTSGGQRFKDSPHQFEGFAARIFQMHDRRVIIGQITRASIDGGRDAIGRYVLGLNDDPVYVDCALEAKCYPRGSAEPRGLRRLRRYALPRRSSSKRPGLCLVQHSHTFNQFVAIPMHEEFVMPIGELLPGQTL